MKIIIFLFSFLVNSQELKKTFLTLYSDNFAVVSQNYFYECRKGINEVVLIGMPKTIISDSFSIFVPKDLSLISCSYKIDEENHINQKVEVLTEDNTLIKGTLLKDGDPSVLIDENGNYITLNRKYIKYINYGKFNEKDYRRKIKNAASVLLNMNSKDTKICSFNLNYMINSIGWSCSYDAYINEDETSLDIKAKINISNNTGHDFKNTSLMVIAGSVNRVEVQNQLFRTMAAKSISDSSFEAIGSEDIKPQSIVEQYSYTLPSDNISLYDGENVSFDLFSRNGIKFEKYYVYKGQIDTWYFYDVIKNYRYDKKLTVNFIFRNDKQNSLDIPLPQGKVRVYKKKDGFMFFAGEDNIKNMPVNSKIEISCGKAFDVEGERKIVEHKKILPNVYRDTIEIKIRNEKKEDIKVKVKEYLWGRWKIIESSNKYTIIDANNIEFDIIVSKGSSYVLKYIAEYDFNN
ncbi:MAG: DUF4139 domain-containing protein [Elusimicrobiales bacterium]|nr:DUF4139 domain-containing protein [Elusimicrobiales bacterium]